MPTIPVTTALRDYVTMAFGIDVRALAMFRIALGLTSLGYVVSLTVDYRLLLTGDGVAPARLIWPAEAIHFIGSEAFYAFADSPAATLTVLMILATAASLLVVGAWSRVAAFVLWLGVNYLLRRNPWLTNAQHSMVLFSLLWAMFLPIGARWSVDAALRGVGRRTPLQVVSPATAGLLVQIFFLYLTAGLAKSGPEWHAEASAIETITHLERYQMFTTPLLQMLPSPVLAVVTRGVWWLEVVAPLLLFWPVFFTPARIAAGLGLIGLHLGLGAFMRLGVFPWICVTFLLVTLPGPFWDRLVPGSGFGGSAAAQPPKRSALRMFGHAVAALLLVCTLTSYMRLVPGLEGNNPAWMRELGGILRLGHVYRLFSSVGRTTSRLLVVGTFDSGKRLDLLSRGEVVMHWNASRLSIAPDDSDTFPWVYYSVTATGKKVRTSELGNGYAGWLCDAYRDANLRHVEIHRFVRAVPIGSAGVASRTIYETDC